MSSWVTLQEPSQESAHTPVPPATPVASTSSNWQAPLPQWESNTNNKLGPKRLNKAGASIINAFLEQNGDNYSISHTQAAHLAEKIRTDTGYDGMDANKVKLWLSRHGKARQERANATSNPSPLIPVTSQSAPPNSPSTSSLPLHHHSLGAISTPTSPVQLNGASPSTPLSSDQIQLLQTIFLREEFTDDLITLWAKGLNVERRLVEEWLWKEREGYAPPTPISPTVPLRPTLPETHAPGESSRAQERSSTPVGSILSVQPKALPPPFPLGVRPDRIGISTPPVSPYPPPFHSLDLSPLPPKRAAVRAAIIEGVKGTTQTPSNFLNSAVRPKNAEEFKALFSAFEPTMQQLGERLKP